jgi:hypothetical protein
MINRNRNQGILVSLGFVSILIRNCGAKSGFVSVRETEVSGEKIETVSISSVSILTLHASTHFAFEASQVQKYPRLLFSKL